MARLWRAHPSSPVKLYHIILYYIMGRLDGTFRWDGQTGRLDKTVRRDNETKRLVERRLAKAFRQGFRKTPSAKQSRSTNIGALLLLLCEGFVEGCAEEKLSE